MWCAAMTLMVICCCVVECMQLVKYGRERREEKAAVAEELGEFVK